MGKTGRIDVFAHTIALRIARSHEGKNGAREIDGCVCTVGTNVSVNRSAAIGVSAKDCTRRIHRVGLAADRSWWIEAGERAFL